MRFSRDKNSSSNMKIDTLSFVNLLLANHSAAVFHPHVESLVPVSIHVCDKHDACTDAFIMSALLGYSSE